MSLIKQLMVDIEEARMLEEAQSDEMIAAELAARKAGLLDEGSDECSRIAAYWRSHGGMEMSDSELRAKVGDDVEALEYDPAKAASAIARIMKMVKKRS